ncbi:MAG: methylated-DNA--[protein]-cysteine S-methyltransferase [Candidatus Roizmanbacteria bacterium]|nr:methylated-DNA--[protein]-cysteine S-methyltransferase [Candidatus Roizmanbacteria bacterium]
MQLLYHTLIDSPLGTLLAISNEHTLVALDFADSKHSVLQQDTIAQVTKPLASIKRELNEYFNHKRKTFATPIAALGTPLQEKVWAALIHIPYAATKSYSDIAQSIRSPKAVRAVGTAIGKNPLVIIIPCHRVISKNGGLGGYGGGLKRKQHLLSLEKHSV